MKMCTCFFLLLPLLLFHRACSAETNVTCPSSISSTCTCLENDQALQEISCNKASLMDVKTAVLGANLQNIVWKLKLYNIGYSTMPKDYIKNYTALTDLEIAYGDLSGIEPGAFNGGSNLKSINFGSNKITWLSGAMFDGVSTNLQELSVSSNDIEYLYSDLEDVFLKISTEISLLGNKLKCTCQNQWLAELLQSDKDLPDIKGTSCKDTNNVAHSLSQTNLQFTDCPDVCSEGFHNCGANETCIIDSKAQSFSCSGTESKSTSSSVLMEITSSSILYSSSLIETASNLVVATVSIPPTLEPSSYHLLEQSTLIFEASSASLLVTVSIFPTPEPSSLILTDQTTDTSTIPLLSSILPTPKPTYPMTEQSTIVSETKSQSEKSTKKSETFSQHPFPSQINSTVFSLYMTPSPTSLIEAPVEMCGSEFCQPLYFCTSYCECPTCMCQEGSAWTGNIDDPCIAFTIGQGVCVNDGLIGISWPAVVGGTTITLPCCSSGGKCTAKASRTCIPQGEWTDFSGDKCVSTSVYKLQSVYSRAQGGDSAALSQLTSALREQSMNRRLYMLPEDLEFLLVMITQTIDLVNSFTDPQVIVDIVGSVSNLLNENQLNVWKGLDMPSAILSQLFKAIEKLGSILPLASGIATITTDNLVLRVIIPEGTEEGWTIPSTLLNGTSLEGQSSIYLPGSIIQDALQGQNLSDCNVRVVASLWDVETSLLEVNDSLVIGNPEVLVHGMCGSSSSSSSSTTYMYSVNSIVISATLFSPNCMLNTSDLSKPVRISFHHINQSLDNPTCSFLDPEDNSGSEWIGGGCRVKGSDSSEDLTVCECFHLTSFALLMSPTGTVSVSKSLLIATKVGLCVSITALILTCLLLFILKLESDLNKVHRQLALALCLSQIVFLVGVDRISIPYPDAACTAIAAVLHYLLLCTFAWELVEGVHLYLFIVRVFYNKKVIWSYYPIAWGIPLIIVGITLGLNFCDYGSLNFCWITTEQGTNWAFHGPVILVIIINVVVLVIITVVVIRSARRKDPESCGFCNLLQASFVLVPTLGLTWILGFFVVSDDTYATVIEWIFLVCTTLQGLFIFIIHCVLNTEVRASLLKKLGFREAAKKQKSVFSMRPSIPTINSIAASGLRRLSLGTGAGSRRGSLEPLNPENTDLQTIQENRAQLINHPLHLHLDPVSEDSQEEEEMETKLRVEPDEVQLNGGLYPNKERGKSPPVLMTQQHKRTTDQPMDSFRLLPDEQVDPVPMTSIGIPEDVDQSDVRILTNETPNVLVTQERGRCFDDLVEELHQSNARLHPNQETDKSKRILVFGEQRKYSDGFLNELEDSKEEKNFDEDPIVIVTQEQSRASNVLLKECDQPSTIPPLNEEGIGVPIGNFTVPIVQHDQRSSSDGLSNELNDGFFPNKDLVTQEHMEPFENCLLDGFIQPNHQLLPNEKREEIGQQYRRKSSIDEFPEGLYQFETDQEDSESFTEDTKSSSSSGTDLNNRPVPDIVAEFTANERVEGRKEIKLVGFITGIIHSVDDIASDSSQLDLLTNQEKILEPVLLEDPTNIFFSNSVEDLLLQRAESSAALLEEELKANSSDGDLLY